jgi:hypothetical protein
MHDDAEIAFYRAVEDLFASLRGVHHILSSKDFQLMRKWWAEQVPYEAIAAGLTEVFTRRRERDDADTKPITSLSYCRHAVASHARRLRDARVGMSATDGEVAPGGETEPIDLTGLLDELLEAESAQRTARPAVADAIRLIRERVAALPETLTRPAEIDEALFTLEAALLHSCLIALPADERREIVTRVDAEVTALAADETVAERTYRALVDQAVRSLLALPRLETG